MNKKITKIKYFDLWGSRKEKYKFLESHDVESTEWQELELKDPYYFFVPKNTAGEKKYQKFISLKNIFERYNSGVQTKRDNLAIDFHKKDLENKIRNFISSEFDEATIKRIFKLSGKGDIDLKNAQIKIKKYDPDIAEKIFPYFYRPLDIRYLYFSDYLISRTRKPLSNHLLDEDNIALVISRKLPINTDFKHAFAINKLVDIHAIADQSYFLPLYLYQEVKTKKKKSSHKIMMLFDEPKHGYQTRTLNINKKLLEILKDGFGEQPSPEKIFHYIYAILYSNIYRQKYNEFLKIDFPRIPFTKDFDLFKKASKIGQELVELHLLKSTKLQKTKASFPTVGDSIIQKREYNAKEKRIYINDKQYFENIKPEIWNYYIGGYQVLDKWLKDRIGKTLLAEDIKHYLKIITAIKHTIELQKKIDQLYSKVEKSLIKNHQRL